MQPKSWKDMVMGTDEDLNGTSRPEEALNIPKIARNSIMSARNSLISGVAISSPRNPGISQFCKRKMQNQCYQYKFILASILLTICGVLQIIFPPYDILMSIRVRMIPGIPTYDWWLDPPDEVVAKVYIFNVTNSESFNNGTDKKIKLQEVGPIIYREKLVHSNISFNENGTFTYTATRTLQYLPDRNPIDIRNQTVTIPNMAVLLIPSYFYNAPFFVKFGINLMIRKLNSQMFKTATIEEILWNTTDPILEVSQQIAPTLVPKKNVGILAEIYQYYVDTVTVSIGPKYSENDFFKIQYINGTEYLPERGEKCGEKITGASEGLAYYHNVKKNDTLKVYRKTLCKIATLNYSDDMERYGIKGQRYLMDKYFYNRTEPEIKDCFKGEPKLPNGLIDVSPCHYDSSVALSHPHFLYGDQSLLNAVEGLSPDPEKHLSFVELEPNTGVPLQGKAKSQLNLVVKDMRGFNEKLRKFSNLNIPLVWLEYHQEGLPPKIQWMLWLVVIVLPVLQKVMIVCTFVAAITLSIFYVHRKRIKNHFEEFDNNQCLPIEREKFLK